MKVKLKEGQCWEDEDGYLYIHKVDSDTVTYSWRFKGGLHIGNQYTDTLQFLSRYLKSFTISTLPINIHKAKSKT